MPYSDQEREQIIQHLDRFGIDACPLCGSEELELGPDTVALVDAKHGTVETERSRPVVPVSCRACGHMMLFRPQALGLTPGPLGTGGAA